MFYSFIRVIVRIIVYIVNGKPTYLNKEKLPTGNYILVVVIVEKKKIGWRLLRIEIMLFVKAVLTT